MVSVGYRENESAGRRAVDEISFGWRVIDGHGQR